jgi:drug/metabolite transporter (DMT)-like permease
MTGALWAVFSGIGFGVFQSFNRRAVQGMDVYVATFLQLLVSAVVLVLLTLVTDSWTMVESLTGTAVLNFALAGILHFFIGWTFLNASQKAIGAARTSSLIGTIPIFGALFALVTLGELPTLWGAVGIGAIVMGVYLVNDAKIHQGGMGRGEGRLGNWRLGDWRLGDWRLGTERSLVANPQPPIEGQAIGWRSLRLGLAAALCWSFSPTFIRYGLAEVDDPLLGVTVGIVASALGYAVVLGARSRMNRVGAVSLDALGYKVLAAVLVAVATWMRWISLDLIAVAVALALSLTSVPTVNFLSPLISGRHLERVTTQVWLGSGVIIGGSLVLIFLN